MRERRTLLDILESMPPYKVRAYAHVCERNGCSARAMTLDEIITRSGLPSWKVKTISVKRDWLDVGVEDMLRFCAACDVELMHLKPVNWFIERTNGLRDAKHIKKSQKRKFYYALLDGERNWRGSSENCSSTGISQIQA